MTGGPLTDPSLTLAAFGLTGRVQSDDDYVAVVLIGPDGDDLAALEVTRGSDQAELIVWPEEDHNEFHYLTMHTAIPEAPATAVPFTDAEVRSLLKLLELDDRQYDPEALNDAYKKLGAVRPTTTTESEHR